MRIALLFLISSIILPGIAQTGVPSSTNFKEIADFTEKKYGIDQQLVNGNFYQYMYKRPLGHPFLFEENFIKGSLIFRETEYKGILMILDIFENILIISSQIDKSQVKIILPIDFVTSFSIYGMKFKKYSYNSDPSAYFQVVAEENKLSCLYYWEKSRVGSYHNITFPSYKYSDDKCKKYLLIDDVLAMYRNNRSFQKIFPKQLQQTVASYLRSENHKVNRASDTDMKEIVRHCNNLLMQIPY